MAIRSEAQRRLHHSYDAIRALLGDMPPGMRQVPTDDLVVILTLIGSELRKYVNNWGAMPRDVVFSALNMERETGDTPRGYAGESETHHFAYTSDVPAEEAEEPEAVVETRREPEVPSLVAIRKRASALGNNRGWRDL